MASPIYDTHPVFKAQLCLLSLKLTFPALCCLQPYRPSSWVMFLGHMKGLDSKDLSSIPGPVASFFLYLGLIFGPGPEAFSSHVSCLL